MGGPRRHSANNAPALIKINGECVPINNQILPPDAPRNLLAEIGPPTASRSWKNRRAQHGCPRSAGVGRFSVSAMRQRGSLCGGDPLHRAADSGTVDSLNLPPVLASSSWKSAASS